MEQWSTTDVDFLNTYQLLTSKPVIYLVNLTEKDYARKKNKWLAKIHAWVMEHGGGTIIPFSGAFECELQARSIHWFPYDRVRVVNADP